MSIFSFTNYNYIIVSKINVKFPLLETREKSSWKLEAVGEIKDDKRKVKEKVHK